MLVFDICNEASFIHLKNWMNDVEQYAPEGVNKILVGQKQDINDQRVVAYDRAKELADSLQIPYVEASAKTNAGVENIFSTLAADVIKRVANDKKAISTSKALDKSEVAMVLSYREAESTGPSAVCRRCC